MLACDNRTAVAVSSIGSSRSSMGVGASKRLLSVSATGSRKGLAGKRFSLDGSFSQDSGVLMPRSLSNSFSHDSDSGTSLSSSAAKPRVWVVGSECCSSIPKPTFISSALSWARCLSALRCRVRCNFSRSDLRFFSVRLRSRSISSLKLPASISLARSSILFLGFVISSVIAGYFSFLVDVLDGPRLPEPLASRGFSEYRIVGLGERASIALILNPCESGAMDGDDAIESAGGIEISEVGLSKLRLRFPGILLESRARIPLAPEVGRLGIGIGDVMALISCSRA